MLLTSLFKLREIVVDGVTYVDRTEYDLGVLIGFFIGAAVWFFVFAALSAWWRAKYFAQRTEIPEDYVEDFSAEARKMRAFIEERMNISSKATWAPNQVYIAKHKEFCMEWINQEHLEAILWLLYSIGIGVSLFLVEHDNKDNVPPPEGATKEHKWKYKGNRLHLHSLLLFLLSSVSLMALAAFLF